MCMSVRECVTVSRISSLSSLVPCSTTGRSEGHHLRHSFSQFESVDFGTITRCGPLTLCAHCPYPRIEIVCRVLPSGWVPSAESGRDKSE
jgi:hypothetical protein